MPECRIAYFRRIEWTSEEVHAWINEKMVLEQKRIWAENK